MSDVLGVTGAELDRLEALVEKAEGRCPTCGRPYTHAISDDSDEPTHSWDNLVRLDPDTILRLIAAARLPPSAKGSDLVPVTHADAGLSQPFAERGDTFEGSA